jgi:hypothetical protein
MTYKSELEEHYKRVRARLGMGVKAPVVPRALRLTHGGVSGPTGIVIPAVSLVSSGAAVERQRRASIKQDEIDAEVLDMPKMIPLPSLKEHPGINISKAVVNAVADRHGIAPEDILGSSRKRPVMLARFECMYRLRVEYKMSYPAIGARLDRDHSTVMHGVRVMHRRVLDEIKKLEQHAQRCNPAGMVPGTELHASSL